jgi:hypothetical protein
LECDDEYWENPDPELAFKQPPDEPSTVTFFNCYLQLGAIMGYALCTIVRLHTSSGLSHDLKFGISVLNPEVEDDVGEGGAKMGTTGCC